MGYGICHQEVTTKLNLLDDVYERDLSLCYNLQFRIYKNSSQLLQQHYIDISNWYKVTFF